MPTNDETLPRGITRSRPRPAEAAPLDESTPAPRPRKTSALKTDKPDPEGAITAIEPQAKREGRVNIYVDGVFVIGLFEDVAAALGLKIGQPMTGKRLSELAEAEHRRKAREDAYRLLSFRARTEREISDRLKQREYEENVIADTVQYLREQNLLDDADFATRFAANRSRTHGDRAIGMELRQKGVAAETIKETLAENADEDQERATVRALAVKRVGERPSDRSPQAKSRLWAFLARRGFGSGAIKSVVGELYGGSRDDEAGDEE